jgi:hypothetical protein
MEIGADQGVSYVYVILCLERETKSSIVFHPTRQLV